MTPLLRRASLHIALVVAPVLLAAASASAQSVRTATPVAPIHAPPTDSLRAQVMRSAAPVLPSGTYAITLTAPPDSSGPRTTRHNGVVTHTGDRLTIALGSLTLAGTLTPDGALAVAGADGGVQVRLQGHATGATARGAATYTDGGAATLAGTFAIGHAPPPAQILTGPGTDTWKTLEIVRFLRCVIGMDKC